jgi:hypothetical protein
MHRRGESVPFAFVAESERFRSNVDVRPARRRRSARELAGNVLLGTTIVAGLVGALVLGQPALEQPHHHVPDHPPAASGQR